MFHQTNDPHLDMIRNKFFKESLMGIAVFGIPAFIAVILGRYVDTMFDTKRLGTLLLLIVAFISSWVVIYFRNKRITAEYRAYRAIQKEALAQEETTAEEPSDAGLLVKRTQDD